jgi:ferrochelatase
MTSDTQTPTTGVLIMAYGTPSSLDELEAYYTHIRHGRPPASEALAELRERYEAIGESPLTRITVEQMEGIAANLPEGTPVALGCKHVAPFIEDGVEELLAAGVDRIVGFVLAPHYSSMSIGQYMGRARTQAGERAEVVGIDSWAVEPAYLDMLSGFVQDQLETLLERDAALAREDVHVFITAHSLPTRILEQGDPYPNELAATASALAERCNLQRWSVAWQSAGQTGEPWIGPDILDAMSTVAEQGAQAVLVCCAGFVSDHLEVLYDLDIEAADRARELDVAFARTPSPNARPEFVQLMANIIRPVLSNVPAGAGASA